MGLINEGRYDSNSAFHPQEFPIEYFGSLKSSLPQTIPSPYGLPLPKLIGNHISNFEVPNTY